MTQAQRLVDINARPSEYLMMAIKSNPQGAYDVLTALYPPPMFPKLMKGLAKQSGWVNKMHNFLWARAKEGGQPVQFVLEILAKIPQA